MNKWLFNSLSLLAGHHCLLCGTHRVSAGVICDACQGEFQTEVTACEQCAIPLNSTEQLKCASCLKSPPAFNATYSLALYRAPLDRLIQQFKFQHKLSVGRMLGTLLAEKMAENIKRERVQPPDVLIPVPLHPQRLRHRGYNQAIELARPVADILKIPLDTGSCFRVKSTTEQSGLSADARASNINDAFVVKRSFEGMRIAVIDDVMTTGSTVKELSSTLVDAGAEQVDIWVCARAVL